MDDWDSVSNDTPPDSATDPWDAVSAPQPSQGYQQQQPAPSTPSSKAQRRRSLPPDNLIITDASQPDSSPEQGISMMQSLQALPPQDHRSATSLGQTDLEISVFPDSSYTPISSPPVKRTALFIVFIAVALVLVISGVGVFQGISIHNANVAATATTDAKGTAIANQANTTATAQVIATATTAQQIYTQATSGTPALYDPLSDDRNSWGVFTTDWGGQCAFTGGAYHLSLSKAGYIIVCVGGSMGVLPNSANFALQVQINVVQGDEGGFYFGDAKAGSYGVFFNSSGTYTLYQYTRSDDKFHYFPPASNPAIKAGLNQVNVFTAIVRDSYLYLYANAQLITSDYLSAYEQGGGGFIVESPNQPTDVAFSSLKIWTF